MPHPLSVTPGSVLALVLTDGIAAKAGLDPSRNVESVTLTLRRNEDGTPSLTTTPIPGLVRNEPIERAVPWLELLASGDEWRFVFVYGQIPEIYKNGTLMAFDANAIEACGQMINMGVSIVSDLRKALEGLNTISVDEANELLSRFALKLVGAIVNGKLEAPASVHEPLINVVVHCPDRLTPVDPMLNNDDSPTTLPIAFDCVAYGDARAGTILGHLLTVALSALLPPHLVSAASEIRGQLIDAEVMIARFAPDSIPTRVVRGATSPENETGTAPTTARPPREL